MFFVCFFCVRLLLFTAIFFSRSSEYYCFFGFCWIGWTLMLIPRTRTETVQFNQFAVGSMRKWNTGNGVELKWPGWTVSRRIPERPAINGLTVHGCRPNIILLVDWDSIDSSSTIKLPHYTYSSTEKREPNKKGKQSVSGQCWTLSFSLTSPNGTINGTVIELGYLWALHS